MSITHVALQLRYLIAATSETCYTRFILARQHAGNDLEPHGHYAGIEGAASGAGCPKRAKAHAKQAGASELRIGVLANNGTARRLYPN